MPSIKLSVNVNKVATLRNSRGGSEPDVLAGGRDVRRGRRARHYRASARRRAPHQDVGRARHRRAAEEVARGRVQHRGRSAARPSRARAEGSSDAMHAGSGEARRGDEPGRMAGRTRPWTSLTSIVGGIKKLGVRVSLFIDPVPDAVKWAAAVGGDRVELYTEPFARAFEAGRGDASFKTYADGGGARTLAGPRRQRGSRSRPEEPVALPPAPSPARKSRSATRSSAMRCMSGSSARCAIISHALR